MKRSIFRRWWAHALIVIIVGILAMLVIHLHRASGETADANARKSIVRGRSLARAQCANCHAVDRFAIVTVPRGPAFSDVADMPSTTELSLRVFLRTSHEPMPNIILKNNDVDDIVAYILSLKHS